MDLHAPISTLRQVLTFLALHGDFSPSQTEWSSRAIIKSTFSIEINLIATTITLKSSKIDWTFTLNC